MKSKPRFVADPVVEEVRSIRAEPWSESGGTVAGLIRLLEERRRAWRRPTAAGSKRTPRRAKES